MSYDDPMNAPPAPATATPMVAERLPDRLALLMARQIEGGAWAPGDRLPTEPQLAEAHGVSRTVVREAVHQLRSQGLLVSRQGSGVFVAQPPAHRPLQFDPHVLDSMTSVVQIVEVRRAIEGEIAALAARRATRAQVASLRKALGAVDAATQAGQDGVEEDLAFHRAIAQAAGNPHFGVMLGFLEQYLREAMRVTRSNEARNPAFMVSVRAEHRAIVDAIAAHDEDAARQAATHHMHRAALRLEQGGVVTAADTPRPRAGRATARK